MIRAMPKSKAAPHPDARRFGSIIHAMRRQHGWTLAEFARQSRMTAQYLGQLERGQNIPSLVCIINLAQVFGVDPGDLVREVAAGRKAMKKTVVPSLPVD
jgi:transcriptional regulator with XRE-family HTH domain